MGRRRGLVGSHRNSSGRGTAVDCRRLGGIGIWPDRRQFHRGVVVDGPGQGRGGAAVAVEQRDQMAADVAAGSLVDRRVEHGRNQAQRPAVEAATQHAGGRRYVVAGYRTVERRQDRHVLQWIEEIDQVAESEAVLAPESRVGPVRRLGKGVGGTGGPEGSICGVGGKDVGLGRKDVIGAAGVDGHGAPRSLVCNPRAKYLCRNINKLRLLRKGKLSPCGNFFRPARQSRAAGRQFTANVPIAGTWWPGSVRCGHWGERRGARVR